MARVRRLAPERRRGAAAVRVRMWGTEAATDHVARSGGNRAVVDTEALKFATMPRELAASELRTNGTRDTVEVEVASNGASAVDTQYLAWFEVAYRAC